MEVTICCGEIPECLSNLDYQLVSNKAKIQKQIYKWNRKPRNKSLHIQSINF